ncbi:MAG: tetratricopeptide repeat protein [Acidobacteria bacterium]|nr:tetratricopeptide repeat protein [Acidobacteriota bacterium]
MSAPLRRGVRALLVGAALALATGAPAGTAKDPEALFARGMELYRGGDFNGAAALFVEAASLRSDFVEARYYAGESLLKGFPTDLPGAEAQFLETIRLKPGDLDGMLSLAQTYFEWGRYEKAGETLSRVLALSPDHRGALYYSGVIAARRGEDEKAISFLRAALKTDPSHVPSRIELGLALSHISRDDEALAAFQEALKAEPANERALFGAGNSLTRLGRIDEARETLLRFRAVQSANERAEMKETRIQLWLLQTRKAYAAGSLDEARGAVSRLLEEFPDEPRGLASLGWLQEKAGESAGAIATYEKVLKLQPSNLTANYQLIGLYLKSGRKDLAEERKARYDELMRKSASPRF